MENKFHTTNTCLSKLGMTKYKAKIPMILKDYRRRVKLFNKYLEADIRTILNNLGKEIVRELQSNRKGKARAIVEAIKKNPKGVSSEFRRALGNVKVTDKGISKELKQVKEMYNARYKKAMKTYHYLLLGCYWMIHVQV